MKAKSMNSNISIEQKVKYFAKTQPDTVAIRHINESGSEYDSITYKKLYQRALAVAYHLFDCHPEQANSSLVVMLQPGIDFSVTYLACLLSGLHAVPVKAPDFMNVSKSCDFIRYVIEHSQTEMIMLDDETLSLIKSDALLSARLETCVVINVDRIQAFDEDKLNSIVLPEFDHHRINHLQYTSGSTSKAKAVIVRHKQLDASLQYSAKAWCYSPLSITVTWAPHSHVYGLVCGVLLPLYSGGSLILLATNDVVMNPELWIQTLAHYRATHSGCPNFGYELCNKRLKQTNLSRYDLSQWLYAVNGGETVQSRTMNNFAQLLGETGFERETCCPAYGMSEMAGLISTKTSARESLCFYADQRGLIDNHVIAISADDPNAREIVSCGTPIGDLRVVIVDPSTQDNCAEGQIGEICLHSISYCYEYLHVDANQNQGRKIMDNRLYFATGDLGFIHQEQLFLTGRLKELIIINGKNYHPHDIEAGVQHCHKETEQGVCVTFLIDLAEHQGLCIIQETHDPLANSLPEREKRIRSSIYELFNLNVLDIVFVGIGHIPTTSSGKVQRSLAAEMYMQNKFINSKQYNIQ